MGTNAGHIKIHKCGFLVMLRFKSTWGFYRQWKGCIIIESFNI